MMNLTQLTKGQSAKVIKLDGGGAFKQRLQNLGVREGVTIKKVRALSAHGPIVIKTAGTEIALGKGMASTVIVDAHKK